MKRSLTASCFFALESRRKNGEGVFAPAMLDGIIAGLQAFNDRTLRADINNDQKKVLALVESYFHCG